jgi:hypothetical protein
MLPHPANGNSPLSFWPRVREFAVPPSMIETATVRRGAGDWAGACAAAGFDIDLDLRSVTRVHGRELAATVRADLRRLAPDLLRWHLPRVAPDGLLRPGLTLTLARYPDDAPGPPHLVVRTPPAWADGGQRISLALWDGTHRRAADRRHPHPRPNRRFRLDLHRHLWDARRSGELWERSGAGHWPAGNDPGLRDGHATHRWAGEAALLLRAEGLADGAVAVRLSSRHRLVLHLDAPGITSTPRPGRALPVLPDAATWVLPDLELVHAGFIDADRLHPLVASALLPDRRQADASRSPDGTESSRLVQCRGATHRIGVVNGVLVPLDHDPGEIRREELLVALGGAGLPCLQAIDAAHRHPEDLVDVRARLDHGDVAGALAVVEGLLGPDAHLRGGALRDELETAAQRQVAHGLYRAGLAGRSLSPSTQDSRRRSRRRHATSR